MYRLSASYFCAGVVMSNGRASRCAPIVKYMLGWDGSKIIRYAEHMGWKWELLCS